MQSMHLSKGPRSWCRAVLTGWGHGVKLIQKDTGGATGQREGNDLSCHTAHLERGRSVVLKDAGVVFGSRARNKYNIPPGAPTYTKLSSSPPMRRCGGQKGCRERQWCRSSVPSQGYQGSSKVGQTTCCQSGISSKRRCSRGLGGRSGRFLEEGRLVEERQDLSQKSLVTLNQVSDLFTCEGDVAGVLVCIQCFLSLVQT